MTRGAHVEPRSGDVLQRLSVVVPAYNEEAVLPVFHRRLAAVLDVLAIDAEIVYVNDGSTDATELVIESLRLADARHGRAAIRPEPDVLERFVFIEIREIHAWRRAEPISNAADPGRRVRDSDQLVGVRVRQGLDRHVVHDREDRRIRSDADGQRADGENREPGRTKKASKNASRVCH